MLISLKRDLSYYEDKEHHNAVFVGVDENGIPRRHISVQQALLGVLYA